MSSATTNPGVMTSIKRPRTPSQSSTSSNSSPSTQHSLANNHHPPHKSTRIAPGSLSPRSIGGTSTSSGSTIKASSTFNNGDSGSSTTTTVQIPVTPHPLLCTLPPTCHRHPTPIADTNDLERHYATYHAHVCSVKSCGCVFPDARLLELHQTECHDPIASLRKERGEKIFQCHLPAPTCGRNFLTPKARRLHLIQAHAFPKEYFFAVTNKGVGGLLKKWGEGASLIRKEWKARDEGGKEENGVDMVDMKSHRGARASKDDGMAVDDEDDDDDDDDQEEEEEEEEEEPDDLEATPRMLPRRTIGVHSPQSSLSSHPDTHAGNHNRNTDGNNNNDLTNLTESLNSLTLVPSSIRFGRGGKSGGFIPRGQGRGSARGGGSRAGKHGRSDRGGIVVGGSTGVDVMEVDVVSLGTGALVVPGRGRAGVLQMRGRGRGRGRANGRGRGGVAPAAA